MPGCQDQLDGGQESKMSDRKIMVPLSPVSTLPFLLSNKSSTWSWTTCHPEYAISQPPLQLDVVMYLKFWLLRGEQSDVHTLWPLHLQGREMHFPLPTGRTVVVIHLDP